MYNVTWCGVVMVSRLDSCTVSRCGLVGMLCTCAVHACALMCTMSKRLLFVYNYRAGSTPYSVQPPKALQFKATLFRHTSMTEFFLSA